MIGSLYNIMQLKLKYAVCIKLHLANNLIFMSSINSTEDIRGKYNLK